MENMDNEIEKCVITVKTSRFSKQFYDVTIYLALVALVLRWADECVQCTVREVT